MIRFDEDKEAFLATSLNDESIFSAFGTKKIDSSDDNENLKKLCELVGLKYQSIYRPVQTHSSEIQIVYIDNVKSQESDGVITQESGILLAVKTADCVPIIFADKIKGIIGISHQGWKGTLNQLAVKMSKKMVEAGSKKEDINIAIGPAIGLCCFEVKNDVYSQFQKIYPQFIEKICNKVEEKYFLNLSKLNYLLLMDFGVSKEKIEFFPFCTFCDKMRFHSYRRDYYRNPSLFGQQLSFIVKR